MFYLVYIDVSNFIIVEAIQRRMEVMSFCKKLEQTFQQSSLVFPHFNILF